MSDYLDRLVLRSRGELPVPRPQLAPVFPAPIAIAETEDGTMEPPQRLAAPEHRSARHADSRASFKGKTSESPRPMPDEVSVRYPARASQGIEEQQVPLLAARDSSGPRETRPGTGVDGMSLRQAEPPAEQRLLRGEEQESVTAPRSRRAVPAQAVTVAQTAAPISPERRLQEKEAGAPQTIHVSIGRVEVRAVMPPAPRPVAPPPGPQRLSLEEYMKARREKRKG